MVTVGCVPKATFEMAPAGLGVKTNWVAGPGLAADEVATSVKLNTTGTTTNA
jgi:hypothetical protein